jgi:hypothetical protein
LPRISFCSTKELFGIFSIFTQVQFRQYSLFDRFWKPQAASGAFRCHWYTPSVPFNELRTLAGVSPLTFDNHPMTPDTALVIGKE